MTMPPGQHRLVGLLRGVRASGTTAATSTAPGTPELVSFTGFIDGDVTAPWGSAADWLLMYLDSQLQDWLLIEQSGIVETDIVVNDISPAQARDVIWVRRGAAVGRGSGPQSDEARFLTGEFTLAGDFEAGPAGGTMAASTGVFCGANTAFCCRRSSQTGGG